ncbi:type II toxin-antitoxin system HicB family antitoxin [Gemmiger formicilis]|nr:type II toxin-antitoxin system HicB family antitoxin [Gemmiger formicilis]
MPDVEGCFTQGDDMNEAVAMTQEAIGLMLEDCKGYPKPSSPADIRTEPGDFVTMIPFDEAAYKKQQKPVKRR